MTFDWPEYSQYIPPEQGKHLFKLVAPVVGKNDPVGQGIGEEVPTGQ